ncbi:MAG: LCP family protein [Firmicutes bacterium]|nr:LCP family protein [Bacillota bacterium]
MNHYRNREVKRVEPLTGGALTERPVWKGPLMGAHARKRSFFQRLVLWTSAFLLPLLVVVYAGLQQTAGRILEKPLNILVLGFDESTEENGVQSSRTDTIFFIAWRPQLKKAGVFSVPRDSLVEMAGFGEERINMAYVYGGYQLTRETVERLLGLPVHRFVGVDFAAFKELVDLVGGVEIDVDKRMLYTDKSAGLHIDLQPGLQRLDGEKALGYVRYRRDPLGDITRVRRQQRFLSALAGELKKQITPGRLLAMIRISRKYLQTDLSPGEIFVLYYLFTRLDPGEDLAFATLPGEFYKSYWRLHGRELERMLAPFVMTDADRLLESE